MLQFHCGQIVTVLYAFFRIYSRIHLTLQSTRNHISSRTKQSRAYLSCWPGFLLTTWLRRWSFGIYKYFHLTLSNGCNYLSIMGLKFNHDSKENPCCPVNPVPLLGTEGRPRARHQAGSPRFMLVFSRRPLAQLWWQLPRENSEEVYHQISNIRRTKSQNLNVSRPILQLSFHNEWRCSWSSADRRCSNYIWVINSLIDY